MAAHSLRQAAQRIGNGFGAQLATVALQIVKDVDKVLCGVAIMLTVLPPPLDGDLGRRFAAITASNRRKQKRLFQSVNTIDERNKIGTDVIRYLRIDMAGQEIRKGLHDIAPRCQFAVFLFEFGKSISGPLETATGN